MQISITVNDGRVTPDEHRLLRAICDMLGTAAAIAPEDRPDAGQSIVQELQPSPQFRRADDPARIFGGQAMMVEAAAPLAPLPAAANTVPVPPAVNSPTTSDVSPPTDASEAPNPQPPQLDAKGLPWDARIHAGTKALNNDGTWRAKRGLNDAALVARVEAELRAIMAAPAAALVAPPPPHFISPEAAAVPLPPQVPAVPVTGAPAASTAPDTSAAAPLDFAGLMKKATGLMSAGKLSRDELEACAQSVGLPNVVGAVQRLDLLPSIAAAIDQLTVGR